jgi:hypothetical protein
MTDQSDPLAHLEEDLAQRDAEDRKRTEEVLGMPHAMAKAFGKALFSSDVDITIESIKTYLQQVVGIDVLKMNVELTDFVADMRKHISLGNDASPTLDEMRAKMRYLDLLYLGFLVHEYREFLFASEDEG